MGLDLFSAAAFLSSGRAYSEKDFLLALAEHGIDQGECRKLARRIFSRIEAVRSPISVACATRGDRRLVAWVGDMPEEQKLPALEAFVSVLEGENGFGSPYFPSSKIRALVSDFFGGNAEMTRSLVSAAIAEGLLLTSGLAGRRLRYWLPLEPKVGDRVVISPKTSQESVGVVVRATPLIVKDERSGEVLRNPLVGAIEVKRLEADSTKPSLLIKARSSARQGAILKHLEYRNSLSKKSLETMFSDSSWGEILDTILQMAKVGTIAFDPESKTVSKLSKAS